jgi:hypothetical protein
MRRSPLRTFLLATALWAAILPAVAAGTSRVIVLETFSAYEALNADFLSSVGAGHDASGKPYEVLRKELEAFAEGPFGKSLVSAKRLVCEQSDAEVVAALFRVTFATSNSANEEPAWTLGGMFVCQPSLVARQFKALPSKMQPQLYDMLEFGFENIVFRKSDARVTALREKLHALSPWVQP